MEDPFDSEGARLLERRGTFTRLGSTPHHTRLRLPWSTNGFVGSVLVGVLVFQILSFLQYEKPVAVDLSTVAVNTTQLETTLSADLEQVTTAVVANRLAKDPLGNFAVALHDPLTAFGEVAVGQLTPHVQLSFAYNLIFPELLETFLSGDGACAGTGGLMACTIGSGLYSYATIRSLRRVRYRPGFGALARFTARFVNATGVVGSLQLAGPGNAGNGFFFGVNSGVMGVMHRRGGRHEQWTLTITTAATATETATLALGGVNTTVDLTDATAAGGAALQFTASQFAAQPPTGWDAFQDGADVIYFHQGIGDVTNVGNALFSGGTVAGTLTVLSEGVAATESWVNQSDWNIDPLDGTGPSNMTLDPTKGNVYAIRYQWLGFGAIRFYVESNLNSGEFILVHVLRYPNTHEVLSVEIPSFPLMWAVASLGSTTPMGIYTGSAAGFVEGMVTRDPPLRSVTTTQSVTSEANVLCIRVRPELNGVPVHSEIVLSSLSLATDGSRSATIRVYLLPTTVGAGTTSDFTNWAHVSTTDSLVDYDTASQTHTGGYRILTLSLAKVDSLLIDWQSKNVLLERAQVMCITGQSAASNEITASLTWNEVF